MRTIILLLLSCSAFAQPAIDSIDFATGTLGQSGKVNLASQCSPPNTLAIIVRADSNFSNGKAAVRFQTNLTDTLCPLNSKGKRNEVSLFTASTYMQNGTWFQVRTRYPSWQPADPRPETIWQMHQPDNSIGQSTPLVELWVENNVCYIVGSYIIGGVTTTFQDIVGTIVPGVEDVWTLHYVRSITGTGVTEVYRNGYLIWSRYGANCNDNGAGAIEDIGYFKWGMYKWVNAGANPSKQGARVVFVGDVKIGYAGNTIADLQPIASIPTPSSGGVKMLIKL